MNTIKKSVWCVFSVDGMHQWSSIPDTKELSDVQFLKTRHRHTFNFKCYARVDHGDRDIEFIHMKRDLLDYINKVYYDSKSRSCEFGSQSCEMLGEELLNKFSYLYRVEIDEDNENGGIIERIEND